MNVGLKDNLNLIPLLKYFIATRFTLNYYIKGDLKKGERPHLVRGMSPKNIIYLGRKRIKV